MKRTEESRLAPSAAALGALALAIAASGCAGSGASPAKPSTNASSAPSAAPPASTNSTAAPTTSAPPNSTTDLEVGTSRTIVKDFDMGGKTPALTDVVRNVDRKSTPDAGSGRTFKVLSATGETLPDGKYRLTMRISLEAPGTAELVYRPTGDSFWKGQVVQGVARPVSNGELTVLLVDGNRMNHFVTIPEGKTSFLDGKLHDIAAPVSEYWKDGEEKEIHFVSSACGCPVEFKSKRAGNKIEKLDDNQVIFPDDPELVARINKMMGW